MANYLNIIIRYLLVFFLTLVSWQSFGQKLSSKAEVSVLTFGPGTDELYSAFGHSAIRIHDQANRIDWAYNYGTFDFNQPNFYLNFAKGNLIYKLAIQDFRRLKDYYVYHNRSITEQLLNLSQEQKQKVFDYLQNNAKPENAGYAYDYFYDNCATKIGDVFVEALGGEFKFNDDFVDEQGLTIRTLTDRYSAEQFPWGKLGIDLCLGVPMDKQLSNMQFTFLPDYVYKAFIMAEIKINGNWQPVVRADNIIFQTSVKQIEAPIITPKLVFWSLWVIIVLFSVFAHIKNFSLSWLDFLLFFVIGLLGLFLLLLWLATDHAAAAWNLNLLWAWPSHIIMAFYIVIKNKPRWVNWYFLFTAGLGVLLIVLWPVIPQAINSSLIPITLTLVTRAIVVVLE